MSDDALAALFYAFRAASAEADRRERLAVLAVQAVGAGLRGRAIISSVLRLAGRVDAAADEDTYRFAFFVCREAGNRLLCLDTAALLWATLLAGRFRLLHSWLAFCETRRASGVLGISEDVWLQTRAFASIVHEDLSNFDRDSAWPTVIDEFVESLLPPEAEAANGYVADDDDAEGAAARAWLDGGTLRDGPRSALRSLGAGSKRRAPCERAPRSSSSSDGRDEAEAACADAAALLAAQLQAARPFLRANVASPKRVRRHSLVGLEQWDAAADAIMMS